MRCPAVLPLYELRLTPQGPFVTSGLAWAGRSKH